MTTAKRLDDEAMTELAERTTADSETGLTETQQYVAWVLRLAETPARRAVHRTTLQALLNAANLEDDDAESSSPVGPTLLASSLLKLRQHRLVELSENGFALTTAGEVAARSWDGSKNVAARIDELVSRWQRSTTQESASH